MIDYHYYYYYYHYYFCIICCTKGCKTQRSKKRVGADPGLFRAFLGSTLQLPPKSFATDFSISSTKYLITGSTTSSRTCSRYVHQHFPPIPTFKKMPSFSSNNIIFNTASKHIQLQQTIHSPPELQFAFADHQPSYPNNYHTTPHHNKQVLLSPDLLCTS